MTASVDLVLRIQTVGREQPRWLIQTGAVRELVPPLTDDDLRAAAAESGLALHADASTWSGLLDHLGSNAKWQADARTLERVGRLLHEHLIRGRIAEYVTRFEAKARARGAALRYVVHIFEGEEEGLLPRLPYELLHHEGFWFRRPNAVGVRLPPVSEPCDVHLERGTCVLIASAHVDGSKPSAEELAVHAAAIAGLVERAGFTARTLLDCTPDALRSAVEEGCDLLYVACHGEDDLDRHGRLRIRGGDVTGRELGEWLEAADAAGRRTQAAILCACSSATPGRRQGTMGMAQHLASTGRRASAAVGFSAPINVAWALAFMTEVFGQLAVGRSLELAVASARRKQPEDDPQWALPLMFAHERDPFGTARPADEGFQPPRPIQTLLPTAPRTYFTGRQPQLDALRAWRVSQERGSCAVLVGEGGVGKSEIARVIAHEADASGMVVIWLERPGRDLGRCFVTMIEQRDPGYRPREKATFDDIRAEMTRALGPHEGLLVLDDVEHAATVDTLTPGKHWKVLVTTRQRALLPAALEVDVEPLAPADAVVLLAKLTREGAVEEPFGPEDAAAARSLVDALGCLPLAIELASGLIRRGASFEEARLAALSEGGDESVLGRVGRMMDRSLAGLELGDEAAWTLTAALGTAGVTEGDLALGLEEPAGRAGRRLFRLRQANLVRFQTAKGRYTMHPLARQVARARARAGGTWDATLAGAARVAYEVMKWCDELLERDFEEANRRWRTQRDFIETLEIDHLPVEGLAANRLARALICADNFRLDRSQAERLTFVEAALVRAKDPETLAHAHQARGALRESVGELEGAASDLTTALELYTQVANTAGLANVHLARGSLREKGSDLDGAEADYQRTIELSAQANYDLGLANAYMARGALRERRDDLVGAAADFDSAFNHYGASRNELGLANTHMRRGALRVTLNDLQGADDDYTRALELYQAMGHRLGMANTYRFRSDLKQRRKDLAGAEDDLLRAIEISSKDREKLGLANAHTSLSRIRIRQRKLESVESDLGIAIKLYSELDNKLGLAYAHETLGKLQQAQGDTKSAEAQFTLAINLHPQNVDGAHLAWMYLGRGLLRQRLGKRQDAGSDFAQASEIFATIGDESGQTAALTALTALTAEPAE